MLGLRGLLCRNTATLESWPWPLCSPLLFLHLALAVPMRGLSHTCGCPCCTSELRAHPLRIAAPRLRWTYGQRNHHRGRPRATFCTGPGSSSVCSVQRTRVPGTQSMTSGTQSCGGPQRAGRPVVCIPRTCGWDVMEVGHCGSFKYRAQGRGPT